MKFNMFVRIILSIYFGTNLGMSFTNAQEFRNLDFQDHCDSSNTGLCHWELSWGNPQGIKKIDTDDASAILLVGEHQNSVLFVEQSAPIFLDEFRILTVSASIKSVDVMGKGAGLNVGIYDHDGHLIATKDMGGGFYTIDWIKGSSDWKNYSISMVMPPESSEIKIGVILYGKGKALFSEYEVTSVPINDRIPSALARKYIRSACDTIARHSLVRDSIDIDLMKETAFKIAGQAKTYPDCYLAINYLLESLRPFGDHHSFFMSREEVVNWETQGSQISEIVLPEYQIMDGLGYLSVPPFHGGNPEQMKAYADELQMGIRHLNALGIKGWIVDLRKNTGGNMEPMIAGLGPLFSASKLGSLVDVRGKPDSWYYKDGRYYGDGYEGWSVSQHFQPPKALPIAVLTSGQTGSSGEIVVISFIDNLNTRTFGEPTWGLTTGNGDFELPDGSRILLASTIMADRNGNQYIGRIIPNTLIEDDQNTAEDEIIEAAKQWILNK